MNSYFFKEESMCRQNFKAKLLPSNTNCEFINIRNNRKPWRELANTTTFHI